MHRQKGPGWVLPHYVELNNVPLPYSGFLLADFQRWNMIRLKGIWQKIQTKAIPLVHSIITWKTAVLSQTWNNEKRVMTPTDEDMWQTDLLTSKMSHVIHMSPCSTFASRQLSGRCLQLNCCFRSSHFQKNVFFFKLEDHQGYTSAIPWFWLWFGWIWQPSCCGLALCTMPE